MRKNFGSKPMVYPMPVFIIGSYDENGIPDAMNAAWGGISEENEISICLSPDHKTVKNILKTGFFTVSMATADYIKECDYVGVVSANEVPDKFAKAGFHEVKSEFVNAPLVEELPMALECKMLSYDEASCRMVGEIINVSADEKILDSNGKISPAKLRPITFDPVNHTYIELGAVAGTAFKDGLKIKN